MFMRRYMTPLNLSVVVALMALVGGTTVLRAAAPSGEPKRATFEITNAFTVKVPEGAQRVRMWFAVPQQDTASELRMLNVEAPYPVSYGTDASGNTMGYMEVSKPQEKQITFRETFTLTRTEIRKVVHPAASRPLTDQERTEFAKYLQPSTHVVINDQMKTLAEQIVAGEQNPVAAARKIYDWTLQNIDYWVKDPELLKASPVGSSEYCLRTKTGNCTDFHSLFSSLTQAVGIPTRMVYGSLLKPTLNGLDIDASYHCWIQFYAPNLNWVTLDVSVADLYVGDFPLTEKNQKLVELTTAVGYRGGDQSMVDYYFGNLDERRVVWSIGRDLQLAPPQETGPVNALHKMHVEIDGKEHKDWTRHFTYREVTPTN